MLFISAQRLFIFGRAETLRQRPRKQSYAAVSGRLQPLTGGIIVSFYYGEMVQSNTYRRNTHAKATLMAPITVTP